jgi:hypothetical protein
MVSRDKLEYFQKRLESAWRPYLEFEEKIEQMLKDAHFATPKPNDEQVQEQIVEYYNEVNVDYRNTLYGSMLIVFCSLAEHIVKEIAKEMVPDYENKIKNKRGDWLVKNLGLIKDVGKLDIDENDVELLSCYIKVRNCLVHDGGVVSNSRNPDGLKNAISKIQEFGKQGNYHLLDVSNDGHLILRDNLVGEVYIKIEDILEVILDTANSVEQQPFSQ